MITEAPVINTLDVSYHDGSAWVDLNQKATQVVATRGGKRNGLSNAIAVGTLECDLYGELDVTTVATLRPNTPFRVAGRDAQAGSTLFALAGNPPSTTGWSLGQTAPSNGLTAATQARPAKGSVPAASRLSYGFTPSAVGGTWMISSPTVAMLSRALSGLPPRRRFRISAQVSDWNVTRSVPVRLRALIWHNQAQTTGTTYETVLGNLRKQDETAYTDVPAVEFNTYGDTAPSVVSAQIVTTQTLLVPASSSGVWMGFDVYTFVIEMLPEEPTAVFTGVIEDVAQAQRLNRSDGSYKTFTKITAYDNVKPIANTTRYGAVVEGGAGYETWEARMRRLAESSPVPCIIPMTPGSRVVYLNSKYVDGWTALAGTLAPASAPYTGVPTVPPTVWPVRGALFLRYTRAGGALTAAAGTLGLRRVLSGLVPGATYRLEVNATIYQNTTASPSSLRLGVAGIGVSAATAVPLSPDAAVMTAYQFVATNTTHTLEITNAAAIVFPGNNYTFSMMLQNFRLTRTGVGDPYRLQDVVFEGNLAAHFDLACNSTGARWWVDSANLAQFRASDDPVAVAGVWTDDPAKVSDVGVFEYVDVDVAFDTRNLITEVTFDQHGREVDTDGEGKAKDYKATFGNVTGVRRWGQRSGAISTCLYAGQGFENALQRRSTDLFAKYANAAKTIRGFRWNAQESTATALGLDIYDGVKVEHRGLPVRARIVGLKHTITPTRWMVDVTLTDIQAGVTFEDFNRAIGTRTFTQLDAIVGAKSFIQFDAAPLAGL